MGEVLSRCESCCAMQMFELGSKCSLSSLARIVKLSSGNYREYACLDNLGKVV